LTVEEVGDDIRVEHRPPDGNPLDRVYECRYIDDAVFQQVTETGWVNARQFQGEAALDRLREQQDTEPWPAGPQSGRRLRTFMREGRWHANIDDRHVWLRGRDDRLQGRTVRDGAGDLDARLHQQAYESLPQQGRVVGNHDAHGSSAITTVP
jgi:hypothetical protein